MLTSPTPWLASCVRLALALCIFPLYGASAQTPPDPSAPAQAAPTQLAPPGVALVGKAGPVSREAADKAIALVAEGRTHMSRKRWAKAIASFTEAAAADPSSWGTYELAGALASSRRLDEALAVLDGLAADGCPMCKTWVSLTKSAKAFAALRKDPRHAALLARVSAPAIDYAALTKTLIAELEARETTSFDRAAAAHATLRLTKEWYFLDPKIHELKTESQTHYISSDASAVGLSLTCRAGKKTASEPICAPWPRLRKVSCVGTCCTPDYGGRVDLQTCSIGERDLLRVFTVVRRVCWWPLSDTEAVPVTTLVQSCEP